MVKYRISHFLVARKKLLHYRYCYVSFVFANSHFFKRMLAVLCRYFGAIEKQTSKRERVSVFVLKF